MEEETQSVQDVAMDVDDEEAAPLAGATGKGRHNQVVVVVPSQPPAPAREPRRLIRVSAMRQYPLFGHLFVLSACLVMTLVAALVKLLDTVDPFFVAGARNVLILGLSLPFVIYRGDQLFPRDKLTLLTARAVCGNINLVLSYYAFRAMPLGDSRMISATGPIFVTIIARVFLKEPCGIFEVFNITATMGGVLIVMQPPILFGSVVGESHYTEKEFTAAALLLVATMLNSVAAVAVRALKNTSTFLIMTWNGAIGIIPPLLLSYFWGSFHMPAWKDCLIILLIGAMSFLGQLLVIISMKLLEANENALARKSEDILAAYAIQVLYFHTVPSPITCLGAAIIFACVILSGVRKILKDKSRSSLVRTVLCLPPWNEGEEGEDADVKGSGLKKDCVEEEGCKCSTEEVLDR